MAASDLPKWSVNEQAAFTLGVLFYGKHFDNISRLIGTRSAPEVEEFFQSNFEQSENFHCWKRFHDRLATASSLHEFQTQFLRNPAQQKSLVKGLSHGGGPSELDHNLASILYAFNRGEVTAVVLLDSLVSLAGRQAVVGSVDLTKFGIEQCDYYATSKATAHKLDPPAAPMQAVERAVPSQPSHDHSSKVCANCGTTTTPLWRKECGVNMCNACGIYYKNHGFHRPVELIRAATQAKPVATTKQPASKPRHSSTHTAAPQVFQPQRLGTAGYSGSETAADADDDYDYEGGVGSRRSRRKRQAKHFGDDWCNPELEFKQRPAKRGKQFDDMDTDADVDAEDYSSTGGDGAAPNWLNEKHGGNSHTPSDEHDVNISPSVDEGSQQSALTDTGISVDDDATNAAMVLISLKFTTGSLLHASHNEVDGCDDLAVGSGHVGGGAVLQGFPQAARRPSLGKGKQAKATKQVEVGAPNKPLLVCCNCFTSKTPLWRKDKENGETLCNACGIYKQTHGVTRPVDMLSVPKASVSTAKAAPPKETTVIAAKKKAPKYQITHISNGRVVKVTPAHMDKEQTAPLTLGAMNPKQEQNCDMPTQVEEHVQVALDTSVGVVTAPKDGAVSAVIQAPLPARPSNIIIHRQPHIEIRTNPTTIIHKKLLGKSVAGPTVTPKPSPKVVVHRPPPSTVKLPHSHLTQSIKSNLNNKMPVQASSTSHVHPVMMLPPLVLGTSSSSLTPEGGSAYASTESLHSVHPHLLDGLGEGKRSLLKEALALLHRPLTTLGDYSLKANAADSGAAAANLMPGLFKQL